MNARIGRGIYVHALDQWDLAANWGVSSCQKWAGRIRPTSDDISCPACKRSVKS